MAVQGPFTWFDRALIKEANDVINLDTDTFKIVFTTSSQALTATFTGSSGDCRYADLTAELSTANGYTNGGLTLTSPSLTRISATNVSWTSSAMVWTLSGSITLKYAVIYSNTDANKSLLCYCDMDTGGGSISPAAGGFTITPHANGILGWSR